eukprot:2578370-Pleurochrysis_carterae.AAC.3
MRSEHPNVRLAARDPDLLRPRRACSADHSHTDTSDSGKGRRCVEVHVQALRTEEVQRIRCGRAAPCSVTAAPNSLSHSVVYPSPFERCDAAGSWGKGAEAS